MAYLPGDHWMACDVCGFNFRSSQMRMRWDRLWVCQKDYETRHPQDFVRGKRDDQRVPVSRPEPEDVFLTSAVTASDL